MCMFYLHYSKAGKIQQEFFGLSNFFFRVMKIAFRKKNASLLYLDIFFSYVTMSHIREEEE